jgi:sarcosine oxidase subunit beta
MTPLPQRADAVIIGGGVIGTSIAAHLAETGVSTVLLERATLGSGSSSSTANVVRTYFPGDPHTGALAVRSLNAYRAFAERTGTPLGMDRVGFMVLFTEEHHVEEFRAVHGAQKAAGVQVELITPADAVALNPLLSERAFLAAAWSPEAYSVDPAAIVRGYAAAALDAGAILATDAPVTGIDADGRVHTPSGSILADAVICAAGAWSREVASMADVDLPVATYPIELLLTDPHAAVPASLPMTLHAASSLRIRAWKDRILIGMGRPEQGEDRGAWLKRLSRQLATTYPALDGIRLHRGWSGAFDASPNNTAFIGRSHLSRPFLYAAGFSGQGLCQAPAAGELVRDLMTSM